MEAGKSNINRLEFQGRADDAVQVQSLCAEGEGVSLGALQPFTWLADACSHDKRRQLYSNSFI